MPAADPDARARSLAPIVAAALVAQQVASNAGRDALFLTHFDVTTLPWFVAGAAAPPARIAARAFEADDAHLRGTALEYFETVLPADLFAALAPRLSAGRTVAGQRRGAAEVRDELVEVGATMTMSLDEVRRRLAAAAEAE